MLLSSAAAIDFLKDQSREEDIQRLVIGMNNLKKVETPKSQELPGPATPGQTVILIFYFLTSD